MSCEEKVLLLSYFNDSIFGLPQSRYVQAVDNMRKAIYYAADLEVTQCSRTCLLIIELT